MAMTTNHEGEAASVDFAVLVDPHGPGAGAWDGFVADVGRMLDLRPAYLPAPTVDHGWIRELLRRAAGQAGPVLVLPAAAAGGLQGLTSTWPPRLHRAVIATDDSPEVVGGARLCALHLLRSGVQTKLLLVLTRQTAPPMWEGTGHQADAWRAELQRRYGLADRVEVCSGSPGAAVRARAAQADLAVLLWNRSSAEGRAKVVRTVLDDGVHPPCLLVPLRWVARMERRMETPTWGERRDRVPTLGA
jgi:hypothetical protein